MKLRLTILCLSLTSILLLAGCRSKYSSLSRDFDNIEAVHVPRIAMWITGLPIRSIDAVSCSGMNGRAEVMRMVDQAVAKSRSELLLEVTEPEETVSIYGTVDLRKNKVRDLIIVSANSSTLDFVTIRGSFSLHDLSESGIDLPSLIKISSSANDNDADDDDDD